MEHFFRIYEQMIMNGETRSIGECFEEIILWSRETIDKLEEALEKGEIWLEPFPNGNAVPVVLLDADTPEEHERVDKRSREMWLEKGLPIPPTGPSFVRLNTKD